MISSANPFSFVDLMRPSLFEVTTKSILATSSVESGIFSGVLSCHFEIAVNPAPAWNGS